jgi:hypothetical protein
MSDQPNPLLGPGVPTDLLRALMPRADFMMKLAPPQTGDTSPAAVFTPSPTPSADEQLLADLRRLSELQSQMG